MIEFRLLEYNELVEYAEKGLIPKKSEVAAMLSLSGQSLAFTSGTILDGVAIIDFLSGDCSNEHLDALTRTMISFLLDGGINKVEFIPSSNQSKEVYIGLELKTESGKYIVEDSEEFFKRPCKSKK